MGQEGARQPEGEVARQPEGEVARQANFFESTQPIPNPIRERSGRPVETVVIQTRSSEDRKSLNVEQTHERKGRPVATLNTADAKDSSRVRSSYESDTFNVEDEELRHC